MSDDPIYDSAQQLAAAMEVVDGLANTFITAAASYREQCIAAGFNETAAEQMSVAMHQALIAKAILGGGS